MSLNNSRGSESERNEEDVLIDSSECSGSAEAQKEWTIGFMLLCLVFLDKDSILPMRKVRLKAAERHLCFLRVTDLK